MNRNDMNQVRNGQNGLSFRPEAKPAAAAREGYARPACQSLKDLRK